MIQVDRSINQKLKKEELFIGYTGSTPMIIDPNDITHLLIAGESGSGKSVLMNGLIQECGLHAQYIALFDLKMTEFGRYENIFDTYTDIESMSDAIDTLHDMMMNRFKEMKRQGISLWNGGHTYIFIDEYGDIVTHENKTLAKNIQNKVASIARMGRAAKMHLIIATQYPTKDVVNMQLKMNCQKICLKCNSDIGYRVMLDKKYIDLKGHGDALFQNRQGEVIHFQVLNYTDDAINGTIKATEEYLKSINDKAYLQRVKRNRGNNANNNDTLLNRLMNLFK